MSEITLRRHRMAHLGDLRVDPKVLTARFDHRCATARCSGRCCITGVWADAAERDAILRHADAVQTHMNGAPEHDPSRWFDAKAWDHADFPSGRGFGTAVSGDGCVFLRSDRRCALQLASDAQTGVLKPLFCWAFPLTVVDGTMCLDDPRDPACCTPSPDGSIPALELFAEELRRLLGADGVEELRNRVRKDHA